MEQKLTTKKEVKIPYLNIKRIAHSWCTGSPLGKKYEYTDFVEHARFSLCVKNKILMKDPIWDSYTDEELLTEYYAHVYTAVKEARESFVNLYLQREGTGEVEDWINWADKQIDTAKKETEEGMVDSIDFDPSKDVLEG